MRCAQVRYERRRDALPAAPRPGAEEALQGYLNRPASCAQRPARPARHGRRGAIERRFRAAPVVRAAAVLPGDRAGELASAPPNRRGGTPGGSGRTCCYLGVRATRPARATLPSRRCAHAEEGTRSALPGCLAIPEQRASLASHPAPSRPGHLPGHRPEAVGRLAEPGRRLLPRRGGPHAAPGRGGRRARGRARPGRHPPRRLRAGRPARDGTRSRARERLDV